MEDSVYWEYTQSISRIQCEEACLNSDYCQGITYSYDNNDDSGRCTLIKSVKTENVQCFFSDAGTITLKKSAFSPSFPSPSPPDDDDNPTGNDDGACPPPPPDDDDSKDPKESKSKDNDEGLKPGAIGGIAVAAILVVGLLAFGG